MGEAELELGKDDLVLDGHGVNCVIGWKWDSVRNNLMA